MPLTRAYEVQVYAQFRKYSAVDHLIILNQALRSGGPGTADLADGETTAQPSSALFFRRQSDQIELIDSVFSSDNAITLSDIIRTPVTLLLAMSLHFARLPADQTAGPSAVASGSQPRGSPNDGDARADATEQGPSTTTQTESVGRSSARLRPYARPTPARPSRRGAGPADNDDEWSMVQDDEEPGETGVYAGRLQRLRTSPYKVRRRFVAAMLIGKMGAGDMSHSSDESDTSSVCDVLCLVDLELFGTQSSIHPVPFETPFADAIVEDDTLDDQALTLVGGTPRVFSRCIADIDTGGRSWAPSDDATIGNRRPVWHPAFGSAACRRMRNNYGLPESSAASAALRDRREYLPFGSEWARRHMASLPPGR